MIKKYKIKKITYYLIISYLKVLTHKYL